MIFDDVRRVNPGKLSTGRRPVAAGLSLLFLAGCSTVTPFGLPIPPKKRKRPAQTPPTASQG